MKLRVFTAFSGYDSQCMALDRLGIDYDLVGWSEIDKYAIQAHNAVYPQWSGRNYGDISKIDWEGVPDFDLFTYSFPCQDISIAGCQRGFEEGSGTRSSLLWECRKAIEAKRPKYMLMENVKALTSKKFMPYLQKWMDYLRGLGYSNYMKVLNAKNYGVPQNRERTFMVSILGGGDYNFPEPFELKRQLEDMLESGLDNKYYISNKAKELLTLKHKEAGSGIIYVGNTNKGGQKGRILSARGICSSLTGTDYKQPKLIFQPKYNNVRLQRLVDSGKIRGDRVEYLDAYNQATREGISGTITARVNAPSMIFISEPKGEVPINTDGYRIRKLTPRECFRLMGVSEENIDKIQQAGISNSQQYKMAGNSIVVDVMYYIFKNLFAEGVKLTQKKENVISLTIKISL